MKRLFIGVPIREPVRAELVGIQQKWAEALDLEPRCQIPPENFHLTLQFLGPTDESLIIPFQRALGNKRLGPSCSITLHQALAFPNPQNARVLVLAGASGLSPLASLVTEITQVTIPLGAKKEERVFTPHVSLFRTKALTLKKEMPEVSPVSLEINRFALFESNLTRQGSVYRILQEWDLR